MLEFGENDRNGDSTPLPNFRRRVARHGDDAFRLALPPGFDETHDCLNSNFLNDATFTGRVTDHILWRNTWPISLERRWEERVYYDFLASQSVEFRCR
jgi:hypothetical protein